MITMNNSCELCAFNNPKATITAVVIRNGKLLLLKRQEEPFKNMLDLPGGYLNYGEKPEEGLRRELKEELNVDAILTFITAIPGTAYWKNKEYAIISFFYLADIGNQQISLNEENSSATWVRVRDIDPAVIAFDSNQEMASIIKDKFDFDFERVLELTRQLDSSATVYEQSLYRAVLNGYVSKIYEGDKLIGMGWIFPRQTMLRKQAVVEDMIVDEAHRGKGLGKKLLADLIHWASEQKIEMIELTSNPARVAANELYKKFGFKLHPTNHYLYKV